MVSNTVVPFASGGPRILLLFLAGWGSLPSATLADPTVRPSCPASVDTCEFHLVLAHNNTMMVYPQGRAGKAFPVRISENGTFFKRHLHHCALNTALTELEEQQIQIGDGSQKAVLLYNGSLPGPPIIVYEGQQVVVHLTNDLANQATTLHFHGIRQHNTPWMDGAGSISQCAINLGETFTYRFYADPVGTHWYHAHHGTQRTMGAAGPLVVLPRDSEKAAQLRGSDPLPEFAAEYLLMISDWMKQDSFQIADLIQMEAISYIDGFNIPDRQCFNSTKQSDGLDCGVVPFSSGLINGKGRVLDENDQVESPVPYEVFQVEQGCRYRFRMICSSMTFGFRVSIDRHPLHVFATDGTDVVTTVVESIVIYSGERYDFYIEADDPEGLGAYWIRGETLERTQNGKKMQPHHVDAVLQYGGFPGSEPNSTRDKCSDEVRCDVINCPFQTFHPEEHLDCVPLTSLRTAVPAQTLGTGEDRGQGKILEYFLNYHFAMLYKWQSTVNGIKNVLPAAPPQVYPEDSHQYFTPCDMEKCRRDLCQCTHKLEIPLGHVVQIVLASTVKNDAGALNGISHEVHLHGHEFQVIKIGYPTYDNSTGYYKSMSPDLACDEASLYCNNVRWADPSWVGGNVPGIVESEPPVKDTIAIPVGGYVVVRFRTTNPGFWYMHCHTEFHNEEGMSMFIQVGNISEMNAAPENMNTCGNSQFTNEEFLSRTQNPVSPLQAVPLDCLNTIVVLQWLAFALGALSIFLLATNVVLFCRRKVEAGLAGYTHIPSYS